MMKNLKRALYYEIQYRNAIVSDSLSFYDINLTKNLIESDFFVKDSDGLPVSCLELVDLSAPADFTEFFKRWFDLHIPSNLKPLYTDFINIRKNLLDAYKLGKREYSIEYWSYDAFSHKIFVSQKFYMTQNEDGEICALSVVKDFTDQKRNEQAFYKNTAKFGTRIRYVSAHELLDQISYDDPMSNHCTPGRKGLNLTAEDEKVIDKQTDELINGAEECQMTREI